MKRKYAFFRIHIFTLVLAIVFPLLALAQAPVVPSRVTQAVDESNLTTLRGNTHPLAIPRFDRGAAPPSLPMQRMLLVLKRSPAQESSLDALLDQQQDNTSPAYHQWLTPDQFGQQFGPSDQDIQAITTWLRSHGFQVAHVSRGRTSIEFSGTASQVQEAFHTAIHRYTVNGQDHWANSSDPQIPSALAAVVAGVNTLHNFPRVPMHHVAGLASRSKSTGKVTLAQPSLYGLGGDCGVPGVGCNALGPFDFATIYNLLPLWNATPTHIDGTGQTIAIVGESDISTQDVAAFRTYFGLPAPNLQIIVDGPDPGIVDGDETESDLDVEWAGATAPGAAIDFVTSESTEASLGVDLSAQYIVDNNVAPILSESYGICELFLGSAGNQFYNQLWQQAAAQGITVLVATGDSGSAVCDRNAGTEGAAKFGLSVSGISSTPYNVAVGGTDFNDLTSASTYWAATNSIPPAPGNPSAIPTVSALSYIPETTWNDSCTNSVFGSLLGFSTNIETDCNNSQLISAGFVSAVGGSGGKSSCTNSDGQTVTTCTGGYGKPSWQTGTGVPSDGKRDLPDVSLFAAINSPSGSFYVVCEADFNPTGDSCVPTNPNTNFLGVGGTSASTPAFAGILALVNQETQSRQGNANYILYKLAAQQPSAFHDVPAGGTIAMPCVTHSTSDCVTNTAGDATGVLSGYNTTTGYDLATGLGSVNANNLVTKWSAITTGTKGTATSLTISPAGSPIPHGTAVPISITVAPNPASSSTPSGQVSLITSTGQSAGEFTLASNGSTAPGATASLLPGGSYTVTAHYAGDGTFAPSDSASSAVVVSPENSTAQIFLEVFNPSTGQITNPNATTVSTGTPYLLRVNVNGTSGACAQNSQGQLGCPTGTVTITDNGSPLDAGTFTLNSQGYAEDQAVQLPGGTDTLKVTYGGDSSYVASSATTVVTVSKMAATISESVPFAKVFLGAFNTVNTVISSSGLGPGPSGQVTFFSGTTQLGSPVPVTNPAKGTATSNPQAQATLTTSQMPLGNDSITAQYSGDSYYGNAVSLPVAVDVQILTSIFATSSSSTINHGSTVTFTATVTPSQTTGPGPTGTVVFSYGLGTIGTVPVTNGQAQITTSALPGGNLTITANYSGDANYNSCGVDFGEVVNLLATTTTLSTSSSRAQYGANVALSAQVAPVQPAGPALTGQVQFWYAFSLTGSDTYIGAPVSLSGGQAQTTTSTLPPGAILVGASYWGDTNYATSSQSQVETITATSTVTTVFPSSSTINQGQNVTFTGNVAAVGNGNSPTGTITFFSGTTQLGIATLARNVTSAGSVSSSATLSTTQLPVGPASITVNYSGDANYTASASSPITETVSASPTFAVTANPTAIVVSAPGQAGSTTLTFTSQNGFTGTNMNVAAACTLPIGVTCGFSPTIAGTPTTTITLAANGTTTANFYLLTTAASVLGAPTANNYRPPNFTPGTLRDIAIFGSIFCGGMLMLCLRRKRVRWNIAFAALTFAFIVAIAACGGGGSSSSGGSTPPTNPGTPPTQTAPATVLITINGISQPVPNMSVTVQ